MSDTTVSRRRRALGLSGQIAAKQFVSKATQEALRAQAQASDRTSESAAAADDDLFGERSEPEPLSAHYSDDPREASGRSSGTSEPPPAPPARKRRKTVRNTASTPVLRCLITLESEPPETISKCYLVGRATSSDRIRQFEYSWGFEAGTFDFESVSNLIYLRADIRCSFDDGGFVILPTLDTIKKIYTDTVEYMLAHNGLRPLPSQLFAHKAPHTPWTYDFVPLKLISQDVAIHRKSSNAAARSSMPADSPVATHTLHQRPFSDFPRLECNAHPFFVIANAMEKFRKDITVILRSPRLQEIRTALLPLWDLWTLDPPDSFMARGAA
ncbi:hypothetical protein OE88DRAFT_72996 [Heliocybe sulcata]|uniref:HNH nuclease domain-containing protein n=1 Tax=Heliocybe sulcata TaxID=5364 RepID=A0A5C3NHP2_9AGAM|nr:hypothetical protein OE88DRAFT_72996 [Heliocybe sulcata]